MGKINTLSIRLTDAQKRFLTELAKRTDRSKSSVLRGLINAATSNPTEALKNLGKPQTNTNDEDAEGV